MKKSTLPTESQNQLSKTEAWFKILRYCAYQERCHKEVKNKLYGFGLHSSEVDELLSQLITERFLNEERFAKSFAGGKFRIMKWGRLKIKHELEMAGLTSKCIALGLKEIDEQDYLKTLKLLVKKKLKITTDQNIFKRKKKVGLFAIGKGYEPEMVWQVVGDLVK